MSESAPRGALETAPPSTIEAKVSAIDEASLRIRGAVSMLARAVLDGAGVGLAVDSAIVWLEQALAWLDVAP